MRLEKLNSAVPRDLATIIHKAIEPEPDHRYATAGNLANDLQRFLDDKPTEARHIRPHERLWRWRRRNPALAALTAVVLLLLVAIAITSSVATVRLQNALADTQAAQADTNEKLWSAYLAQARAGRLSRRPGQRFDGLRAIREALKLPLPNGRSFDDLRTEAIATLCVPDDLEVARQWNGLPTGTSAWAIDDDFERCAWGDSQGNVTVRRIADDQELFYLPGEGVSVWEYDGLTFSPDGRWLHVVCHGAQGWRACLWRLEETQPVAVLKDDHVSLEFRPDSQMFAAAYPDGSLRLFDAETTREARRFDDVVRQVYALLRWNPRLPQIAVMMPWAGCRVLNVESGDRQPELPVSCEWMDWHPEGRLLALGGLDLKIHLYDVATGRLVLPPLEGHKEHGMILRFNHAGDRLASNDWSGMLRLWDTRTGRQALAQPTHGACLAFSRDDRMLAADLDPRGVRLFRCHTSHEFRTVGRRSGAAESFLLDSVRASDGRLLAALANDGVALVDTWRGEEVGTLAHPAVVPPFFFEPHDDALWTSGASGVLRWPLRADAIGNRWRVEPPQTLCPSNYGTVAAASVGGDVVCVPQFDSGALLWRRKADERITLAPQDDVRFAAVSPDGSWVATGTHGLKAGPGAKIWDGQTGEWVADLPVAGLCRVGFSPDGRWLVTTGGGARIWVVGTWQEGPKLTEMPG
ncbi:MAG TPA: hypothetical protein VGX76_18305, partial [Pirellulales bacterium]|nr:hypothetical protein [Pirellulales bacterium]